MRRVETTGLNHCGKGKKVVWQEMIVKRRWIEERLDEIDGPLKMRK